MVFLDSNTIIYLSKELINVDDVFTDEEEDYAISVITYMEVLGYPFKSKEEEDFIKKIISFLTIIYIDKQISNKVIELKKIHKVKLPDAIICASAIVNQALLLTNDIRLKNITNLKLKIIKV